MSDQKPVCLVVGAGAGIGGHVGKRFADGGYHVVLCRRSDEDGLNKLVSDIEQAGGTATGRLVNAVEDHVLEDLVAEVERDIGSIEVVVFNLGAQIGDRSLADTSYKAFEQGWRMATFGLFRIAHAVTPKMEARGRGTILVTSATAAVRGNAGQHSHAAAVGGRRMLCQSLNAEFGPKNIHVAHIVVDGPVEAPDTLGRLLGPELFEKLLDEKSRGKDELLLPAHMAETYFHLAHQHRSAWTHEIDLRPFTDQPWWNN
ncbi:MAG: SDR family NAD(P)-dependent oxidoreductase [Alphaproteobacteria bacterium]